MVSFVVSIIWDVFLKNKVWIDFKYNYFVFICDLITYLIPGLRIGKYTIIRNEFNQQTIRFEMCCPDTATILYNTIMNLQKKILKIKLSPLTEKLLLLFTIVLLFVLLSAVLTDGHGWGDDFALYLQQAKNIAEKHEYSNSGYIYNEREPLYSPRLYPPVYPFFLSLVYKWFGLDFIKLKTVSVIFYVLYLVLLFIFFRKRFSFFISILVVILFGLNPDYFIELDQILSDFTALFFTMLAILAIEKFSNKTTVSQSILIAVLIWLSYASRSAGIVLIPSFILYYLFLNKKIKKELILTIVLTVILIIMQKLLLHESAYFNLRLIFKDPLGTIFFNIVYYSKILAKSILRTDVLPIVLIFIFFVIGGIVSTLYSSKKIDFVILFSFFFLGLLLIFPSIQGPRYIFPLIPFSLMFGIIFLQKILKTDQRIIPVLLILLIIGYVPEYFHMKEKANEIQEATNPAAMNLYEFVDQSGNDGYYFRKPRALAFFADVHAGLISNEDLNQYETTKSEADRLGIRYFVEDKNHFSRFKTIQELNQEKFKQVYENEGFLIYQFAESN